MRHVVSSQVVLSYTFLYYDMVNLVEVNPVTPLCKLLFIQMFGTGAGVTSSAGMHGIVQCWT